MEPEKRGGKPCIRGMRITVYDVLDYLASGMSVEQVLKDFPYLNREDIQACLSYAADRERLLMSAWFLRLLFDQNLSPLLSDRLKDLFPNSSHVSLHSLGEASDQAVWEFARTGGYVLVTKDADFSEKAMILGFPPKVLWMRHGNCSTKTTEALIRKSFKALSDFEKDLNAAFFVLR